MCIDQVDEPHIEITANCEMFELTVVTVEEWFLYGYCKELGGG